MIFKNCLYICCFVDSVNLTNNLCGQPPGHWWCREFWQQVARLTHNPCFAAQFANFFNSAKYMSEEECQLVLPILEMFNKLQNHKPHDTGSAAEQYLCCCKNFVCRGTMRQTMYRLLKVLWVAEKCFIAAWLLDSSPCTASMVRFNVIAKFTAFYLFWFL